ncbi:MAG: leucine-rich repeat protein [Clostridia bacterium]|nr:leucine-rich repeat protein [Clostridia bacterium]
MPMATKKTNNDNFVLTNGQKDPQEDKKGSGNVGDDVDHSEQNSYGQNQIPTGGQSGYVPQGGNGTNNNVNNNDNNDDNNSDNNEDDDIPPTNEEQNKTVVYLYRAAKAGDSLSASIDYTDKIVITGVKNASDDGNYKIPETIDGKTVYTLDSNMFSNIDAATVKRVMVPSSVKFIHSFTFAGCKNLTEVYYLGKLIYTEDYAFCNNYNEIASTKINLYCYADCSNGDFRYYKTFAEHFGVTYKEWDGVLPF